MGSGADTEWDFCARCGQKYALWQGHKCPQETALEKQVGGKHYSEMSIQPVVFITQNDLGFLEGNIKSMSVGIMLRMVLRIFAKLFITASCYYKLNMGK